MRNTIISSIRQGIRNAIESVVSALAPIFYWPGTHTLEATTGTDPTFTRATAATFEDFEGLIKTVESQEPRFQGARRVENYVSYSGNLNDSSWSNYAIVSGDVTDPEGGATAYTFTATASLKNWFKATNQAISGDVITTSIWIRRRAGTGAVFLYKDTGASVDVTSSVTTSWQRLSISWTATAGNAYVGVLLQTSGDAVDIWHPQQENVTGQTNQNPSEYVSTGVASATAPELITNGDFSNGTTGWTALNSTLSIDAGRLKLQVDTNGTNAYAYQILTTVVGLTYTVAVDSTSGTLTSAVGLRVGTSVGSSANGSLVLNFTPQTLSFVATATSTYIQLVGYTNSGAPKYFFVDNVSVKRADHGANVDGVQYFNTLNANTVTSNVVTEAVGSPLTRANTQFGELNGVGSDYFSTPNVVTTWPELDIRVRAQVDSIPNTYAFLADKNSMFYLAVTPAGSLYFRMFTTSGITQLAAAIPNFSFGVRSWYRGTRNQTTGDIKLYIADGNLEYPSLSDWVQIGTTFTGLTAPINPNTNFFSIGRYGASSLYSFDGRIYRSQVFNEIDGTTPVVDFTAGSYVSGSTLVSSTSGETWTLVGNASIFQPPVDASGPFGYLAEKASTNLVIQSEDFTTSWSVISSTISADAAVAPDGTTTMDRLVVTTASDRHIIYQLAVSSAGTTNYTFSVYMKDDGAGFGGISFANSDASYIAVVVDLSTGLVTDTNVGSSTGTIVATGCEDVGNGIYRVWISGNLGVSADGFFCPFTSNAAVPAAWTGGAPQYTGVLGEDILIWGAQAELGTYPTSYIPTTTTAVTRNADVLTAGDMVTDAAGSAYAEASSIWSTATGSYFLLARTGVGRLLYTNTGAANYIIVYDGTAVSFLSSSPSYYNRPAPMASTWGNNLTAYKDGVGGTAASYDGTMGTGDLGIGIQNNGLYPWDGTIREVKIFDSELTAAEVGDL